MKAFGACRTMLTAWLLTIIWAATPAFGLQYVDATPVGAEFPAWDGGDTGLCFADIDQDGHVDILSIGDHGSPYVGTTQHGIMVYFGDGTGGWTIHMEGYFGYGGIAVGDVNLDGHLDVGYGMHHNYSSNDFGDQLIEVALGDGSGMNWTPWDDGLAGNGESWGMFATDLADFDHDGYLDLASNSMGASNGVHMYRNNTDGTWTQTWALTGGNARSHLYFGDVNGDGHADVAASYQYGTIFLGDGTGNFVAGDQGLPGSGGIGLGGISLGDVDQDGCDDLAFVLSGAVRVYVWRTDHWEERSDGLPASGGYEMTQLADLNADGFTDVIALGDGQLSCWLGDGTGQWTAAGSQMIHPAIDTAAFACGGDIDHNGRPDIVLVQEEGSWPSYQNHLYVLREDTVPTERFVRVTAPGRARMWLGGTAEEIRWLAAQIGTEPAEIDIELSIYGEQGPWSSIVEGRPDSGCHQWIVPQAATENARLRVTLRQAGEAVAAISEPFSIQPTDASGLAWEQPARDPRARAGLRLEAHPNPTSGRMRLSWACNPSTAAGPEADWSGARVHLYAATGREVAALPVGRDGDVALATSAHGTGGLPAGVYLLQLRLGGAVHSTRPVLLLK